MDALPSGLESMSNSLTRPRHDHRKRCKQDRLGGCMPINRGEGVVDNRRSAGTHKCAEMKTVLMGLQKLLKEKTNMHVHLRIDKQAALACINALGSPQLGPQTDVAKELWSYCLQWEVYISVEHLTGNQNS